MIPYMEIFFVCMYVNSDKKIGFLASITTRETW